MHVPESYSAMVRGTRSIPFLHESARTDRKAIAAVRVSYLEDGPRYGVALRDDELQRASAIFGYRKKRDRTMFDGHLDR
jgi:hypothetical protein